MATELIPGFIVEVDAIRGDDVAETVILNAKAQAEGELLKTWKVSRAGVVTPVDAADDGGKDNSGCAVVYRDGTVRVFVSEALVGGSGTTSRIVFYDYPNLLPAAVYTDAEARRLLAALTSRVVLLEQQRASLQNALNALTTRVAALEARPAVAGLDQTARDGVADINRRLTAAKGAL